MKRFLCATGLMLVSVMMLAMAQVRGPGVEPEPDVGYCQKMVASVTLDGVAVISLDAEWNIVDLQAPVMPDMEVGFMSAQVVDACTFTMPDGAEVGMTLVCWKWPGKAMTMYNDATMCRDYSYYHSDSGALDFRLTQTEHV